MTHLDPSVCGALSARDLPVLEALREDRDNSAPGVSRATVEKLGRTRPPDSLIARLCKHGLVIGVLGGRYQLGEEHDIERASDTEDVSPSSAMGAYPVASSLDAMQPTLFRSSSSHYEIEAEAT